MADVPITELLMSPRWVVTVGDIDGTPHVVLRIQHTRLGPLDFLLPKNDPIELAAALEKNLGAAGRGTDAPCRHAG